MDNTKQMDVDPLTEMTNNDGDDFVNPPPTPKKQKEKIQEESYTKSKKRLKSKGAREKKIKGTS